MALRTVEGQPGHVRSVHSQRYRTTYKVSSETAAIGQKSRLTSPVRSYLVACHVPHGSVRFG